jgi:uncharacterized membrane protein YesL
MKFNLDSPFLVALAKLGDLMILNMITLICCMPVVTIGPALTAMHYVAQKIAWDEDYYILKSYYKSFKENFVQSLLMSLILVVLIVILAADFYLLWFTGTEYPTFLRVTLFVIAAMLLMTYVFLFPILAKFDNTIRKTFKNAFLVSIVQFPKTICMIIIGLLPFAMLMFMQQSIGLFAFLGFSLPAFLGAKLYKKFFKNLEAQILEANPPEEPQWDDESDIIFRDESRGPKRVEVIEEAETTEAESLK